MCVFSSAHPSSWECLAEFQITGYVSEHYGPMLFPNTFLSVPAGNLKKKEVYSLFKKISISVATRTLSNEIKRHTGQFKSIGRCHSICEFTAKEISSMVS